jgi:hypothetical protein
VIITIQKIPNKCHQNRVTPGNIYYSKEETCSLEQAKPKAGTHIMDANQSPREAWHMPWIQTKVSQQACHGMDGNQVSRQ